MIEIGSNRRTAITEHELFYGSPLPEDRKPREEVVTAYFMHCQNPSDERFAWAGTTMAGVTFYASQYQQWSLILELIERAPADETILQDIAAGSLEGYLGRFDDQVIDMVEREARQDLKFRRVLSGVWKHGMSQDTWDRVRAIQQTVQMPLPEMIPFNQTSASK